MGGSGMKSWGTRVTRAMIGAVLPITTIGLVYGTAGAITTGDALPVEGTLDLWIYQAEEGVQNFWDDFTPEFESRYPNASIEITQYASDEYLTKVAAAFAAGDPPDVWLPNAGEILNRYVRAGEIAPANELTDLSVYSSAGLAPFTAADDNTYAIPIFNYGFVMFQNVDLFDEHGLAAPASWDELLAACDTFNEAGVVPISLGNRGGDAWTAALLFDTIWYQYGGPTIGMDVTFDETRSWNDPTFLQATERFQELIDRRCFNDGFTGTDYSQMQALFFGGRAAMTFDGSWASVNIDPTGATFEVSAFALPDAPGAQFSTATGEGIVGAADGLAASRHAAEENPQLVSAFFDLFGESIDKWSADTSFMSTAAEPAPVEDPLLATLTELISGAGEVANISGNIPIAVSDDYSQALLSFSSGAISAQEFADRMTETVERERPNFDD
jgi:raffinose/stachyose/melibiose transport system substrate-binding protein